MSSKLWLTQDCNSKGSNANQTYLCFIRVLHVMSWVEVRETNLVPWIRRYWTQSWWSSPWTLTSSNLVTQGTSPMPRITQSARMLMVIERTSLTMLCFRVCSPLTITALHPLLRIPEMARWTGWVVKSSPLKSKILKPTTSYMQIEVTRRMMVQSLRTHNTRQEVKQ